MTISTVSLTNTFDFWRQRTNELIVQANALGPKTNISITGGAIDGTVIGGTTPQAGTFTNINATGTVDLHLATLVLADNQINGDNIAGGTLSAVMVELAGPPTVSNHAVTKQYVDELVLGVVDPTRGGTGVENGVNNTITFTGDFPLGLTLTGSTSVTLPTSGTLITSAVTSLPSLVSAASLATVGTITTGVWNGTPISLASFTTGTLPVNRGGTGATDANGALANLGAAGLANNNVFTGQQNFNNGSLVDGASIAWNLNTRQSTDVTLGGNRTLANPTNMVNHGTYILIVRQDVSGNRTLSYGSAYKWPGGNIPVLSTAAGSIDILTFVSDGTFMYGVSQLQFM